MSKADRKPHLEPAPAQQADGAPTGAEIGTDAPVTASMFAGLRGLRDAGGFVRFWRAHGNPKHSRTEWDRIHREHVGR